MLRDWFDSDVQKTVEDLCSLPGDGPKMPFLCLQTAWDVYVTTSTPYRNTDGPSVTSALEWMFVFTGSPTDLDGTIYLLRHPNKPGVYITSLIDFS